MPNPEEFVRMWPTPTVSSGAQVSWDKTARQTGGTTLAGAVKAFPTPTASMSKGSSINSLTRKDGKTLVNDPLDHFVMNSDGGKLNPEWVEWLMGWPIGYTASKPSETDKSPSKPQSRGESSEGR
jgi:hypothetical protein